MKSYRFCFLSPLLLLAFCVITIHAQPGRWAEPVNISNTFYGSSQPDMAIGPDGKIHVVWEDYTRLGSLDWKDILYAYYDGYEWSEPEQVSAMDTTFSYDPSIEVDSLGRPHVVWNHRAIFPDADAYYSYRTDTGWTEPLNLATHGSTQYAPDICIDSRGFIHVVWSDYWPGNGDIYHKYYDGCVWSDYTNISSDPIDSGEPHIVVDSEDNLHVVWRQLSSSSMNNEIFYSKSDGIYWSEKINISQSTYQSSTQPCIALDSNDNPHVVWKQSFGGQVYEIYYSYFDGYEWTEPENITNLGFHSLAQSFAINNNNTKCLLFSLASPIGDPYVHYSFNTGFHWSIPDTIFEDYTGTFTAVAVDSNGVFHACMTLALNTYGDIGYTYYQSPSSVIKAGDSNYDKISLSCSPNPFNSSINISFNLSKKSEVILKVYNIHGQNIAKLIEEEMSSSQHSFIWDGLNDNGQKISTGIYFITLNTKNGSTVQKVLFIK